MREHPVESVHFPESVLEYFIIFFLVIGGNDGKIVLGIGNSSDILNFTT